MATPETASFAISLEDKTSGAAESAASALGKLRDKIDGDKKALAEMQRAMKALQSSTVVNVDAFRELQSKIEKQKIAIADATASYVSLGGNFQKIKREKPGGIFEQLAAQAGKAPGPLGGIVSQLGSMRGLLVGGAIAAGIMLVVAAIVAVAAASIAAAGALLKYGIGQADARRNELLRLEALTKLRRRYGQVAGSATEMQAAIDRVSGSTALGRGKVEEYASQLYRMGLRGENLNAALEGMTTRGAVLGDQYARSFAGMAAGAARSGRSVRALADDVQARLGGLARRQMLSLDVQSRKLRENLGALFDGLRIEGFLGSLDDVTSLFSQNTASGRAMKQILETLFNPLMDGAEDAGPVLKRFFQGMVLAAQGLTIRILELRVWFKRTFGDSKLFAGLDSGRVALAAGSTAFAGLAAAVVVTAVALAALVALIAGPFVLAFYLGYKAAQKVDQAIEGIRDAVDWFQSVDWSGIGKSLIDGLVGGLRRGRDLVVNTVRDLATSAKNALTSALDIHSPSRVFANLGVQIPRGLAAGVDAGAPTAAGAVEDMISIPGELGGGDAGFGGAGASSASAISVSMGDIHVHTTADDAPGIAQSIKDELARVLEGVAITMGAPA